MNPQCLLFFCQWDIVLVLFLILSLLSGPGGRCSMTWVRGVGYWVELLSIWVAYIGNLGPR